MYAPKNQKHLINGFLPLKYKNTLAEIDPELKNKISHRNIAIKKLLKNKLFIKI